MLSEKSKAVVLGNINLLQYCKETGIDINKLKICRIEKMGDYYVFGLEKEKRPKSSQLIPLDTDLETQPDIVLTMEPDENGNMHFQTTNKTMRILAM
jgi:hypothetical protein